MSRFLRRGAAILAGAAAVVAVQIPLAGGASAATPFPVIGTLTITKASLSGGRLLIEGTTLRGVSYISAESTTSVASTRADANAKFKIESKAFTAPDCRALVRDYYHPDQTVTLDGCKPTG